MPHNFGRFQRAAMAQVETFGTALHHAVQFAGDRLWVIFEWRADGMAGQRNAADQDA